MVPQPEVRRAVVEVDGRQRGFSIKFEFGIGAIEDAAAKVTVTKASKPEEKWTRPRGQFAEVPTM